MYQSRAQEFGFNEAILRYVDTLKSLGIDPGLPMAPRYMVPGIETYRFEAMAFEHRLAEDKIHHLFVGDMAKKAGLVPNESRLAEPADDSEVNLSDYAYAPVRIRISARSNNMDEVVRWGASHMGISEGYARKIVSCESEFKPWAANPTSSARGLWQILGDSTNRARFRARGWDFDRDWADPIRNTIIAIDIMRAQGVRAWSCA
jgi:hypothetical protein